MLESYVLLLSMLANDFQGCAEVGCMRGVTTLLFAESWVALWVVLI